MAFQEQDRQEIIKALNELTAEGYWEELEEASKQPGFSEDPVEQSPAEKTPVASAGALSAGQPLHQEDVKEGENHDDEWDDFFEIIKEQVGFDKYKTKKKFNSQIALEEIINHHKNMGLKMSDNDHVNSFEDNLIDTFANWDEIKSELLKGQGSELKGKNGKIKFLSVSSSCALCVNTFALLKQHKDKIGVNGFTEATFEKHLPTGISKPNFDFYLENNDGKIGIESKFTEIFYKKLPNAGNNLEKYINRKELKYLPNDFNKILEHYINMDEKLHLDVAQLIKHTIGLIKNKNNKHIRLVYIFWTPSNYYEFDMYEKHLQEIEDFNNIMRRNIEIDFEWTTYEKFWKFYAKDDLFKDHILKLRNRYNFDLQGAVNSAVSATDEVDEMPT